MSLEMSIKRVKKPFASGCDREVFYSKRYDVVIKKNKPKDNMWNETSRQFRREAQIFDRMTEEEKKIFPIIMVDKENEIIVMKKCNRTTSYIQQRFANNLDWGFEIGGEYKEAIPNWAEFAAFVKKYKVTDLHSKNIGTCDGNLVILDAGYGG